MNNTAIYQICQAKSYNYQIPVGLLRKNHYSCPENEIDDAVEYPQGIIPLFTCINIRFEESVCSFDINKEFCLLLIFKKAQLHFP
jgi:hypothetical protein